MASIPPTRRKTPATTRTHTRTREDGSTFEQRGKARGNGEGTIYYDATRKRYRAELPLPGGKRKKLSGKTRPEVAKKLREATERRDNNLPLVNERFTLGAWIDQWLDELIRPRYDAATGQQVGGREPTTYHSYEILVRRHIKPYLGTLPLARLQPEDVAHWQAVLEEQGASAETRRAALVRLRTALNVALQRSHVTRNVALLVEGPRLPKARYPTPDLDDIRRLLKTVEHDPLRALVYLGLGLGLRRAEILGLWWEDIDLDERVITVHRRVNRVGQAFGLVVRAGLKTQDERRIIMPQFVADALRSHGARQRELWLQMRPVWKGPDYAAGKLAGFVFTSSVGTLLEPRKLNTYFVDVRQRAGLDAHRFHGLRHDFASLLLAAGVPLRVVMELMGHSAIAITANRYQHVPDALQRDAVDRLEALLGVAG